MSDEQGPVVTAEEMDFLGKSAALGASSPFPEFGDQAGLAQSVHEDLARSAKQFVPCLAGALTAVLGGEMEAASAGIESGTAGDLASSLPGSAQRLFKGDAPGRWMLAAIPLGLAGAFLDCLLGATTHPDEAEADAGETPELTDLDNRLLDEVFTAFAGECGALSPRAEGMKADPATQGSDGVVAEIPDPGAAAAAVSLDVQGGAFGGQMRLVVPASLLQDENVSNTGPGKMGVAGGAGIPLQELSHAPVPISARLGRVALTSSNLAALRAGLIVPLNCSPDETIRLDVAGVARFEGRLVRSGEHLAVRIERRVGGDKPTDIRE